MDKVYIRVDGNEIIATGHVMRCLSIADALRRLDCEAVFVVADDRPREMIESRGFLVEVLDTVWNELDTETEKMCAYISRNSVELLLLDTYFATREYLNAISSRTNVIYIDDLRLFAYDVASIIHYSPFGRREEYLEIYKNEEKLPKILCGSAYIPLREEFSDIACQVRENVSKVLVTTGGTDQLNVAGSLMNLFLGNKALEGLEYHIIIGCFHSNRAGLRALANEHENIFIHENVRNMSEYMKCCDVAISAGGTTLYELCASGIPTICLEVADNQNGAAIWQEEDYMAYAGNAYKDISACAVNCEKALLEYIADYDMRKRRSKRMQQLVDGRGAYRIAEYIISELQVLKCRNEKTEAYTVNGEM